MDEAQKIRNDIFSKYREDVLRRQLSNTENYDKAVLSLGTAFLGFSMAFLKDFVSYKSAIYATLLPISWMLFCLSIVATITSFFVSQKGLSTQLEYAEKYYLENDESFLTKENSAAIWTDRVNFISAISFVLAIVTTISFVIINLTNGANMSEKKPSTFAQDAASVPSMQRIVEGAAIPAMLKAPGGVGEVALGAQIPRMQLAPSAPASAGSTGSQSGSGTGSQSASGSTSSGNK